MSGGFVVAHTVNHPTGYTMLERPLHNSYYYSLPNINKNARWFIWELFCAQTCRGALLFRCSRIKEVPSKTPSSAHRLSIMESIEEWLASVLSVLFRWITPPCCWVLRNKGGFSIKVPKSPDFGPFALEIWPKNTTNFPAALGGQKERYKGGGKNPWNTTD